MIWYAVSTTISSSLFVMLLLSAAMRLVLVLIAGDLVPGKKERHFIRMHSCLLAALSAVLALEMLLVISSVEGGLYLEVVSPFRYLAAGPLLLYFICGRSIRQSVFYARPVWLGFILPLLLLPQVNRLPLSLALALSAFAGCWLFADSISQMIALFRHSRVQVTRSALPQIIRGMAQGICVAGHRGRVLETNPAFQTLCACIGIGVFDRISAFDEALKAAGYRRDLELIELSHGTTIRCGERAYLLQRSTFRSGRRKYQQLTMSDVTGITRAANELKQQNEQLQQHNHELANELAQIEQREIWRERENLRRSAHDLWSQRLAVAGFSLDRLIGQQDSPVSRQHLAEIAGLLTAEMDLHAPRQACNLNELLQTLSAMYEKLGVSVVIDGQAGFTAAEEETLCAIIREALANAVRHAYASTVAITLFADGAHKGIAIANPCLEDGTQITEGRGLHDMRKRAGEAGGRIEYIKGAVFVLKAVFAVCPTRTEE